MYESKYNHSTTSTTPNTSNSNNPIKKEISSKHSLLEDKNNTIDFLIVNDAGTLLSPKSKTNITKLKIDFINNNPSNSLTTSSSKLPKMNNNYSTTSSTSQSRSAGSSSNNAYQPMLSQPQHQQQGNNIIATNAMTPSSSANWQSLVQQQQLIETVGPAVATTSYPPFFPSSNNIIMNVVQQNPVTTTGSIATSTYASSFQDPQQSINFIPSAATNSTFPFPPNILPMFANGPATSYTVPNATPTANPVTTQQNSKKRRLANPTNATVASLTTTMPKNDMPPTINTAVQSHINGLKACDTQVQLYPAPASLMVPPSSSTQPLQSNHSSIHYFYDTKTNAAPPQPQNSSATKNEKYMTPEEKRRHERNLREQQRSFKISQQINDLRQVLAEANIPFKPNKFSILMSVVEYIKQLQSKSKFLDLERMKLVDTLKQTSDLVTSGNVPGVNSTNNDVSSICCCDPHTASNTTSDVVAIGNDSQILQNNQQNYSSATSTSNLNYSNIFHQCHAALGIAALDGRFLDCNADFELLSGYTKDELTHQSLFHLLSSNNDMDDVYKVLVKMLKQNTTTKNDNGSKSNINGSNANDNENDAGNTFNDANDDDEININDDYILRQSYWCSIIPNKKNTKHRLLLNITLTRTTSGMPKFFNCALSEKLDD